MSDWQDISTAPKDGFEILVCNASSGISPMYVAYWIEGAGWLIWSSLDDYKTCDPTHWMPLPRLPGEEDGVAATAVATEREACARVAEMAPEGAVFERAAMMIATAIRKRGEG